jgi:hypothetical protein
MRRWMLVLALVGCAEPPTSYSSRVDYAPLEAALREAGGSPDDAWTIGTRDDLRRLASGRRYKVVLTTDGSLRVAPRPADEPRNEYVHPILARGRDVRTAGGIVVEHTDGRVTRVVVDQDSKAYCPSFASLDALRERLRQLGVGRVEAVDRVPDCAPPR